MSKSVSNNVFKKKSGIQNIQAYLESGRSITALEALSNFGIFRLASAIEVLRKRGLSIETEMKEDPNGKTYARYMLGEEKVAEVAPQFKVGDRAMVTNAAPYSDNHGKFVTITEVDYSLPYPIRAAFERGGFDPQFLPSELTLLAPAETPKKELKVGARVRTEVFSDKGTQEGTVIQKDRDMQDAWVVNFPSLNEGREYPVYMYTSELEVI